jgi:hypothetical protein
MELGTKVFHRTAMADGAVISIALVTGIQSETKMNLAVKPDQAPWFDASGVDQRGTEIEGAACWAPWLTDLNPSS